MRKVTSIVTKYFIEIRQRFLSKEGYVILQKCSVLCRCSVGLDQLRWFFSSWKTRGFFFFNSFSLLQHNHRILATPPPSWRTSSTAKGTSNTFLPLATQAQDLSDASSPPVTTSQDLAISQLPSCSCTNTMGHLTHLLFLQKHHRTPTLPAPTVAVRPRAALPCTYQYSIGVLPMFLYPISLFSPLQNK